MREAPFSERIYEVFCTNCKFKRRASYKGCPLFVSAEAVCVRFEWANKEKEKSYQEETLDNWANTIWLQKGKSQDEISAMSRAELRKVLSKSHYEYFEKRKREDRELLERKLAEEEVEKRYIGVELPKSPKQLQKLKEEKEKQVQEEIRKNKKVSATVLLVDDKVSKNKTQLSKEAFDSLASQMSKRLEKIKNEHPVQAIVSTPRIKRKSIFPKLNTVSKNSASTKAVFHYFNCQKPDGKLVVYKRNTQTKNYQSEVVAFRKYLAKQNIAILNEVIK